MAGSVCSVSGCDNPSYVRTLCNRHYKRWRRHGDPLGGGTALGEPLQFFNNAMANAKPGECMIWPYAENGVGYGMLTIGGRFKLAHRAACEHRHGPPPSAKHEAAHSCGNGHKGCFSPFHVEWKTHAENNRDKIKHGTSLRGEQHNMAKLTDGDVIEIRRLRANGWKQEELAQKFGIKQPTISNILSGRSWGWLTAMENGQ